MLLSKTSVIPKLSPCLIKTFTHTLQMKLISDHEFTEGTEIRQAATLSRWMCTAVYPPLLPASPPPDPLSSPTGILLFSWWKRLLGSCTNELALLLNDVCKLWPSLLPMNGAETQNPHRQLGARSHFQYLVVELNWIFGCMLEFGNSIRSSLALPCGVKTNLLISPFKYVLSSYSSNAFNY